MEQSLRHSSRREGASRRGRVNCTAVTVTVTPTGEIKRCEQPCLVEGNV